MLPRHIPAPCLRIKAILGNRPRGVKGEVTSGIRTNAFILSAVVHARIRSSKVPSSGLVRQSPAKHGNAGQDQGLARRLPSRHFTEGALGTCRVEPLGFAA